MARLSAAKRRARAGARDIRAVPELRASAPTVAPPQPEPRRAAEAQAPAVPSAAPANPSPAQSDDDQLARLLAAKQRARKKRDE